MIAPVDVTLIRLETERLILRAWQESDLDDFYEYARVDGVGQMAGWAPHKSPETSRQVLSLFLAEKKTFALELKENGKVIGSLGLEERDVDFLEGCGREIGYVLSKDYWGRGLMAEAVKAVIAHCFSQLDFDWLTCGHFVRNRQSQRVVEKCGFRFARDFLHTTRLGTQEPTKLYYLENEDKIFTGMNAPFSADSHRLETARMVLRPMADSDFPFFRTMAQLPQVAQYSGWDWEESVQTSRERFSRGLERNETFLMILKDSQVPIGTISLQARNWPDYPISRSLRGREFGFDLLPAYWGQGLMPEAVEAVTQLCFETLGFDFVSAGYFSGNHQSARVLEKCGFCYLFDYELTLSQEKTVMVSTHIRFHPGKEITKCLN